MTRPSDVVGWPRDSYTGPGGGLSVTGVTRSHICSNSSNLFPFRRLGPSHRCVGRAEVTLEAVTYATTGLTEHMETKLLSHMP